MEQNERESFFKLWRAAREEYHRPVTAGGLEIAFRALKRFPLTEITQAVGLHFNDTIDGKFPIQISHVVAQIEGSAAERAGEAWSKLNKGISEVGNNFDVVFDDPIIHAIVANEGGWQVVSMMTYEKLTYLQSRFNKQYLAYVSKSGCFKYPRVLIGVDNTANLREGLPMDPPLVVGDKERAREVYRSGESGAIDVHRIQSVTELTNSIVEKSLTQASEASTQ